MPPKVISLVFVAIALGPWAALFLLVCRHCHFTQHMPCLISYASADPYSSPIYQFTSSRRRVRRRSYPSSSPSSY